MTQETEILRLQAQAISTGGYIASLCSQCGWWQFNGGNKKRFEEDYHPDIRCNCKRGSAS